MVLLFRQKIDYKKKSVVMVDYNCKVLIRNIFYYRPVPVLVLEGCLTAYKQLDCLYI